MLTLQAPLYKYFSPDRLDFVVDDDECEEPASLELDKYSRDRYHGADKLRIRPAPDVSPSVKKQKS